MNISGQNYLSRIVFWILALVVGTVPLVFWHGVFFPHIFTKTIVFRTLVELAFAFWLPLVVWEKAWRPPVSLLSGAVLAFFGVLILTAVTGVDFSQSFWSDYERMIGVFTWAHIVLFFFMLTSVVREERQWRTLFHISMGAAALAALFGVIEWAEGPGRVSSTLGNASFFSSYLLLNTFLALALLFQLGRVMSLRAVLYGGAALLFLVSIFLTETRASMVGAVAGFFAAGLIFSLWKYGAHAWVRRSVYIAVLVSVIAGGIFAFSQGVSVLERAGTATGRLLAWQVSWEGWKERFFLGWGPENYHILFNTHYDMRLHDQEPWFDRAHNFIFDIGGASGILGLAAYLSVFAAAWVAALRAYKAHRIGGPYSLFFSALLAAYLVQNLFMFDILTSLAVLFLVIGFLASTESAGTESTVPYNGVGSHETSKTLWAGVVIVSLLLLPVAYFVNAKVFLENAAGHAGWEALRRGDPDERALLYFEKALSYRTHGDADIRRFFTEYVFEFLKQGGERPAASLRFLMDHARAMMEANIREEPENVKWVMYQGELYNLMATRFDPAFAIDAEEYFSRAEEMSPGRAQIYLELAQARKVQGDIDGMWKALDSVMERVPDWAGIHVNKMVHAIDVGDREREEQELPWVVQRGAGPVEIRDAYARAGRYGDAVEAQKRYIALAESKVSLKELAPRWAELAALYNLVKDEESAREAALKVLELDPARKSEVEAFLLELELSG